MKEFRVWSNEYKEYIGEECFISGTTGKAMMESSVDFELVEIHDAVIEFWTGLHDSEGVKIFEGDKIEVSHEEYGIDSMAHLVTSMTEDYPAFDLEPRLSDEMNSLSYITCDTGWVCKVIGTIHEDEK